MHGKINERGKGKERRKTQREKMKTMLIVGPDR